MSGPPKDAILRSFPGDEEVVMEKFANVKDARAWYHARRSRLEPSNSQLFWTLTSWREIERNLFPRLIKLGPCLKARYSEDCTQADRMAVIDERLDAPVFRHLGYNADAHVNMLRYLFFHTRCGIWASIRRGKIQAFVPFANRHYTNTWYRRLRLGEARMDIEGYKSFKAGVLRRRPEDLLHTAQWWFNGGILCNVMPENVWGDGYVAPLFDMLDQTCKKHAVPDCDFFVNKRDFPLLRRDGTEPYAAFVGKEALEREVYSAYAPVFSFYTGTGSADLPLPTTEDWLSATKLCLAPGSFGFDASVLAGCKFENKEPRAVFRGAATGRGLTSKDNLRLRLAQFSLDHPDLLDARVTAWNTRDKVVAVVPEEIRVDFFRPDDENAKLKGDFIPLADQFARFKYVVYADGHCAASRYGTLMHSGSVILRVESDLKETCGHLWLFAGLCGACIDPTDESRTIPEDCDHFLIRSDLSNLEATIVYLRDHDELAAAVAASAKTKAPTQDMITDYISGALRRVHDRLYTQKEGAAWYSPYDHRYARIGRPEASTRMTAL